MPESAPPDLPPARRRPWYRITVLRLMILVAVVGLICGASVLLKRREVFAKRAAAWSWTEWTEAHDRRRPGMMEHFGRLADKYERAARYPWLPVEPDPPGPKD